jgi:hypothetical protein
MSVSTEERVRTLITAIRASEQSSFYKKKWGTAEDFFRLPAVSSKDFVETPLSQRRYKNEKSLVKIVHTEHGPFLSEWSFSNIGGERYGLPSSRPLVYLADPHDALEKALWCYEQGMVPALGEKNTAVTESIAAKYRIDSLICDVSSLRALEPYLRSRAAKLQSISILDTTFPLEELKTFAPYAEDLRLVLALPEAGAFAEAPFSEQPVFTPHPGCVVEEADGLVLTKLSLLATPLVRYKTGISIEAARKEGEWCAEFALI